MRRALGLAAIILVLTLLGIATLSWKKKHPRLDGVITLSSHNDNQRIDRIVLITIDTLRADHLGYHGYPRETSPFIDELARNGTVFQRAFSSMATTAPAHASIFTSLYPIQHNVLKNGHRLNDAVPTMAELLSTMNYSTAGFVSAYPLFKHANVDQGFDVFDQPILEQGTLYRKADRTMDSVTKWLAQRESTEKFFLWIHLYDPHTPHQPPKAFLRKFTKQPKETRESFARFLLDEHHVDLNYYNENIENMLRVIDAYDSEILFVDSEIRRVYKDLREKGFGPHTLWIITSDHGEGLGNHRWLRHGKHIYNEQIHVPLIFYFSSGSFPASSVEQLVEHIDILPTVIELVGGEIGNQVQPVQGSSLVPLLSTDGRIFPAKYAFSQRRNFDGVKQPREIIPEKTNYEEGDKYSLQNSEYKYIHRTQGTDEFYDIREDPYEVNNIVGSNPEIENSMREKILLKIKKLTQAARSKPASVDKQTLEKLRSLGYVQ